MHRTRPPRTHADDDEAGAVHLRCEAITHLSGAAATLLRVDLDDTTRCDAAHQQIHAALNVVPDQACLILEAAVELLAAAVSAAPVDARRLLGTAERRVLDEPV